MSFGSNSGGHSVCDGSGWALTGGWFGELSVAIMGWALTGDWFGEQSVAIVGCTWGISGGVSFM